MALIILNSFDWLAEEREVGMETRINVYVLKTMIAIFGLRTEKKRI